MSTPEQLVNQIKTATDYQKNKHELREKILTDLHFAYNGGLFKATPELFSFVICWNFEELFLEDVYNNPIKINRKEFIELCGSHYHMVMNRWHIEHEKLKHIRKI